MFFRGTFGSLTLELRVCLREFGHVPNCPMLELLGVVGGRELFLYYDSAVVRIFLFVCKGACVTALT